MPRNGRKGGSENKLNGQVRREGLNKLGKKYLLGTCGCALF